MPGIAVERGGRTPVKRTVRNGMAGAWLSEDGEVVPLTARQSERLGMLFAAYNGRVTSYAVSRMTRFGRSYAEAVSLADDVAQTVWMEVARNGREALLGDEPLDEGAAIGMLFVRVQFVVRGLSQRKSENEVPVDWDDEVTCRTLCPVMPEGCAAAVLPGYLARAVAALPELERKALLFKLDGMHPELIADHLKCGDTTAARLCAAAVLLLQIDNPEFSGPPVAPESLEAWERTALDALSTAKREALLRLDAPTRQALLLKARGLTNQDVAKRLGVPLDRVRGVGRCAYVAAPDRPVKIPARPTVPAPSASSRRPSVKTMRVADALRAEITALEPGTRVSFSRALRERFGVGGGTLDRAVAILLNEGLIEPGELRGYRVASRARAAVAA